MAITFSLADCGFYDQTATVAGRPVRACVFPPSKADPLTDASADTDILKTDIVLKRVGAGGWNEVALPKIGSAVEVAGDPYHYRISEVSIFDNEIRLVCRLV